MLFLDFPLLDISAFCRVNELGSVIAQTLYLDRSVIEARLVTVAIISLHAFQRKL
jgi:hypothetical protein